MSELNKLLNVNIANFEELITPAAMKLAVPASDKALHNVVVHRQAVQNILDDRDNRMLVIVGPCSIHDIKAAKEYATKLKSVADKVSKQLLIIMRVYFEKPRTTVGWKGLINDPNLDDTFQIGEGLKLARQLLIDINELGLGTGTEALDPITPQYLAELVTWSAIGARTTESQTHRELSSGLSMPVGFKNGTDGSIAVAINALKSVSHSHHFLGINEKGQVCKFSTKGNPYGHIVLRGGDRSINYDAVSLKACSEELLKNKLRNKIIIDCSHGNSNKDHRNQPVVFSEVIRQVRDGNRAIAGVMIESFLEEGNQSLPDDRSQLKYGVSITDKCVDWPTTEKFLIDAAKQLSNP